MIVIIVGWKKEIFFSDRLFFSFFAMIICKKNYKNFFFESYLYGAFMRSSDNSRNQNWFYYIWIIDFLLSCKILIGTTSRRLGDLDREEFQQTLQGNSTNEVGKKFLVTDCIFALVICFRGLSESENNVMEFLKSDQLDQFGIVTNGTLWRF